MSSVTDAPRADLATDGDGRLYDRRTRAFMARVLPASAATDAMETLAAVRAAARGMHLLMERWAEAERLSEGRVQLLIRLRFVSEGGVSLGELARAMRVTPRTVTGLVDNLERDGLVERVPDPHDRRSILAHLTSDGKGRIDSLWRPAMEHEGRLVEGFTHEQLLELRHLCLRLVENMQDRNAAGGAARRE